MKRENNGLQQAFGPWARAAVIVFILLLLAYGIMAFLYGEAQFRKTPTFTAPEVVLLPARKAGG